MLSRISRFKRPIAAVALVLAVFCAGSSFAATPILEKVPADASVVVVIKDLKSFSGKLGNLATRMNIPGVPADILGTVTAKIGITKGLDQNGSAVFFASMPPKPADGEAVNAVTQPMMFLLPTTDPKALMESFNPSPIENSTIMQVTMPGADTPGYVAVVDKYVAFAQDKEYLTLYLANKKMLPGTLSPEAVKAFDDNDFVVYGNFPTFAPAAIANLDMMKPMIKSMAAAQNPNLPPEQIAMQQNIMELGFNGIHQALTDTKAAFITLRLNDAGATVGFIGHFVADSGVAKFVSAAKPLGSANLDGLPAGDILAAGNLSVDSKSMLQLMGVMWDQMLLTPGAVPEEKKPQVTKYIDLQKQIMGMTTGVKVALYEPKPEQKGIFHGVILATVTDPAKFMELQTQMFKEHLVEVGNVNPQVKMETSVDDTVHPAGGIDFHKFTMKVGIDPAHADDPGMKEAAKMIEGMYGSGDFDMFAAQVGDNQVLTVFAPDASLLESAALAAKSKSTALSDAPEIAPTKSEVLPNPTAVLYMPVDRWITLGKRLASGQTMTPAGAVTIGEKISPMVISTASTPTSMTVEIHAPVSALANITQSIKDAQNGNGGADAPVAPPAQ